MFLKVIPNAMISMRGFVRKSTIKVNIMFNLDRRGVNLDNIMCRMC